VKSYYGAVPDQLRNIDPAFVHQMGDFDRFFTWVPGPE
jgi:hypothetical protein